MARRIILKSDAHFEGSLFGISTTLKDFQLCWLLNKDLLFNLSKKDDVQINHRKKNKTSFFSLFHFNDEMNKWIIQVASNKCLGEFLITEVKQSDYFLLIIGEVTQSQHQEIFEKLKKLNSLQLVVSLDFNNIKSNQNLVFE